jgi:cell division septal protein FtsQ
MRKKKNRYRPDLALRKKLIKHWIGVFFGIALLVVTTFSLSVGLAHAYFALIDSPRFKVREVEIFGLKYLGRDEILAAMSIPPEESLLNLQASELAKSLEVLPWLRRAVVSFRLPGNVVVEVVEREPMAVVHAADFMLIDEDGKLVSRASSEHKKNFITIEGFSDLKLKEGDLLPRDAMRALKKLLAALDQAKPWLPPGSVSELRWDAEAGYSLHTSHKNLSIRLGWEAFERKLSRLKSILALIEEKQLWNAVLSIDLDYSNRAFIEGLTSFSKGN